jgi:DMSO/TMAO reductase YedYZ heme-binding membrane subunit
MATKSLVKYLALVLYIGLLILPGLVFFQNRPGIGLAAWNPPMLFPLLGLYAFTLTANQVIIGSNMRSLRRLFPGLLSYHRFQGLFALTFALLHPLLIIMAFGPAAVLSSSYLPPELRPYVTLGALALTLMVITVATALMAWKLQKFTRVWRSIHLANYAVFILAWIHSWFVGSDIQTSALKFAWLFYLAAWVISVGLRLWRWRHKPAPASPSLFK